MKGLTKKHKELINKRVVQDDVAVLAQLRDDGYDACYACPTHVMWSSIHARIQNMHILCAHPDYMDNAQVPPSHTIIIEANMRNSNNKNAKTILDRVMIQNIVLVVNTLDIHVM